MRITSQGGGNVLLPSSAEPWGWVQAETVEVTLGHRKHNSQFHVEAELKVSLPTDTWTHMSSR